MMKKFLYVILFLSSIVLSQEKIVIVGDSFVGKRVGIYDFREFIGNVVMTQGDLKVTCDRAVQNLTLDKIELFGDVIITQDTVRILTDRGFYFGKEKKAFSNSGVVMSDGHNNLTADSGYYYVDNKRAEFYGNVTLIDSSRELQADNLLYFDENDSTFAVNNVTVKDTSSIIYCDSLVYIRENDFAHAFGNTKIINPENKLTVYSEELFNYGKAKYTKLTGRPLMVKLDSTSTGFDTLYLSSNFMETYYDSTSLLIAKDSVLLKRGEFASRNDLTLYYRQKNKILTYKLNEKSPQPLLWYENSQMAGDSVVIFIENNQLDSILVSNNAILISSKDESEFRFDQISGKKISMKFSDGELKKTTVRDNVLSIYYLYEEEEPNGLIKSSSKFAEILFEANKVIKVNMSGTPASEYHPEKLVKGKEKEFTLPLFRLHNNKPSIKEVVGNKKLY